MLMLMPDMTRATFLAELKALGLKQVDFARIWNTRKEVVSKWGADYKGAVGVPYWVGPALEMMRLVRNGAKADSGQASLLLVPDKKKARR